MYSALGGHCLGGLCFMDSLVVGIRAFTMGNMLCIVAQHIPRAYPLLALLVVKK